MDYKPIETEYRGYRFRSRLEARWAVCFDTLGIPWRYELEGHEFDNGVWYLPDYWLPNGKTWLEVKGQPPTQEEFEKATALALAHPESMVVISWEYFDTDTEKDNIIFWHDGNGVFHSQIGHRWLPNPEPGWRAARLARFEGRRNGLPWCNWGEPQIGELPF